MDQAIKDTMLKNKSQIARATLSPKRHKAKIKNYLK